MSVWPEGSLGQKDGRGRDDGWRELETPIVDQSQLGKEVPQQLELD